MGGNPEAGTHPLPHFCPFCGDYTQDLDDNTGWCASCTNNSSSTLVISSTKLELALAANANAVEFYVSSMNASVWQALTLARQDRPRCIVCGDEIRRSSRVAIFCRKTRECRYYARRYTYLYQRKGLDKTQALAQIMQELSGYDELTGE